MIRTSPKYPSIPCKLVFSLFFLSCPAIYAQPAAAQADNPVADPAAIVQTGQVRFSVLTPELIRMEWAADGVFEDHASLVVINRRLPVPKFTRDEKDGWLVIDTGKLALRYKIGSGVFAAENLAAFFQLNGKTVNWAP